VNNLKVRRVSNEFANNFWLSSPQASVFTRPDVLEVLVPTVSYYSVFKGSEPLLLWPAPSTQAGLMVTPLFSYYVGPFWSATALRKRLSSQMSMRLVVYEAILRAILEDFEVLEFELPPDELDVRAFSWWNFGNDREPKFRIEPRYSAVIDQLDVRAIQEIQAGFRELRRRELRKFQRSNLGLTFCPIEATTLLDMYVAMFDKRGTPLSTHDEKVLESLLSRADLDFAHHFGVCDKQGQVVGGVLVLDGNGVSNLVLNIREPGSEDEGLGAALINEALIRASARKAKCFDFNGANSPDRGNDKHSYGARARLFFRLTLDTRKSTVGNEDRQ